MLGLVLTFVCLLVGRHQGSFPATLLAGAIAGFALLMFSAIAIGRGQAKRIRELPVLPLSDERQRKAAALLQVTTAIGLIMLSAGVLLNSALSLFGMRGFDPMGGTVLVFAGLGVQFYGHALYLERLA